jgi:hypothetical protein
MFKKLNCQETNPLKYSDIFYVPNALAYSKFPTVCIYGLHMILRINYYLPNNINQLIFVMEKVCVFFETGSEF